MPERGVVTLADANYFAGVVALNASVQSSLPCPVACYDIGLSDEQRLQAADIAGLTILHLPPDPLIDMLEETTRYRAPLRKPDKRLWPLWICPLLIQAAPFASVFWIDADILVLRGLDELFAALEDGPVFTPENKAPERTPNLARLYELLPIARAFDPRAPVVNSGVSGWHKARDRETLDAYVQAVAAAAADPAIMDAIAWHDQGALIWAIQKTGREDRVLESSSFNLCIDRVDVPPELLRWDAHLCDRLRAALPDVHLLHWNGRLPPWR